MLDDHLELVEQSIASARELRPLSELADKMFELFFKAHPEADVFFEYFDLKEVGPFKFCKVGDALVDVLKFPDYSVTSISEEVYRHQVHEVTDKEYYFALADAYVGAIKWALADGWTAKHQEYWHDTVAGLRHNVVLAAEEHLGRCPVAQP